MAFSISNVLSHRPSCHSPLRLQRNNNSTHVSVSLPSFPSSSSRLIKIATQYRRVIFGAAASAAGSSSSGGDLNPYEILGVNPIEGFDMVKAAYTKKRKDAERRGDEATAALLERAYDKIMMAQLTKRKKGETFGSFKISKDIKYADKGPIVPWGPRYSKSEVKDIRINLAISAAFCAWNIFFRSSAWTPLQFMSAVFVFRIFEKLSSSESPTYNEEGEDENRMTRMGSRLLRSCGLVFGCVAIASVAFTLTLNLIEFTGNYIPALLYNSQDIFVTVVSAVLLYITASYYR